MAGRQERSFGQHSAARGRADLSSRRNLGMSETCLPAGSCHPKILMHDQQPLDAAMRTRLRLRCTPQATAWLDLDQPRWTSVSLTGAHASEPPFVRRNEPETGLCRWALRGECCADWPVCSRTRIRPWGRARRIVILPTRPDESGCRSRADHIIGSQLKRMYASFEPP